MEEYRSYTFRLHKTKDKEIIDFLEKQRSMTEAVRQAILAYIKKHND